MFVPTHVSACVCVSVCTPMSGFVCAHICKCVCMCVSAYTCECVSVSAFICECVCVCVVGLAAGSLRRGGSGHGSRCQCGQVDCCPALVPCLV